MMEIFWYTVAAMGAGIGTGLAGLSAATVMVPVLIVLCPSFAGETGAYQATAIALASDILGSAVATYTYAKNKNIDLHRGWIMLVCILCMCTVGSYVAYLVGNVVLGSFTLFLTFFIGIRFLVKPDTTRENPVEKGERLDWKGILISLFFGLTIGFGTGFVGTGGGMMMLVVFTMFLGMDVKTAVGTSTFIMTFTALIASVSHILIHPAIILEKWNVMALCIIVATVSSLVSARFANKVSNRTIGLVTGAVLTLLGASMLTLNFWPMLAQYDIIVSILQCLGNLILYIVICIIVVFPIRYITKIPSFVFRKLLHMIAFTCLTVMMIQADNYQPVVLTSLVITVVAYPILQMLENEQWYAPLFVEKSSGEVKRSLVKLFGMFTVVVIVAWGIFDKPLASAASILMWGVGDATAALVGIPLGKHKIHRNKSWEGTLSMTCASFLVGMMLTGTMLPSLIGAIAGATTELYSSSEWDTVTVPIAILTVLLVLL